MARPASRKRIASLGEAVPGPASYLLIAHIYQHFDGFSDDDFDEMSFLRIWPAQQILSSRERTRSFIPFMDFSLNSEIYGLVTGQGEMIFSKFADKSTSVNISSLLEKIVNGRFDNSLGLD